MITSTEMIQLSESWIRVLNKMDALEKSPKDFGSGDLLHCSEIHTLMAVGRHKEINITELARYLGISKSGISQMITRLFSKDLVEKYQNSDDSKQIFIRLSARGMIAYLGHEQHHAKIYAHMTQKLGSMSDEQFMFLTKFLQTVEEVADESMKKDKR